MKTTIIVFHIILLCLLSLVIPLQLYKYGACKLAVLYVFTRGQANYDILAMGYIESLSTIRVVVSVLLLLSIMVA